jgi:hypothetical protein
VRVAGSNPAFRSKVAGGRRILVLTEAERRPFRDAAWRLPRQRVLSCAATDSHPADLGYGQSTITTLRPIVARDSIALTIAGSAENEEVEPAIGRIVPAAIMLNSFS